MHTFVKYLRDSNICESPWGTRMMKSLKLLEAKRTSIWPQKESLELKEKLLLLFSPKLSTHVCTPYQHTHTQWHFYWLWTEWTWQWSTIHYCRVAWGAQCQHKFWSKPRDPNTGKNNSKSKDSNFVSASQEINKSHSVWWYRGET